MSDPAIPSANRCVMVIDSSLPLGVVANSAALLGVSLGKHVLECIGNDVRDASGAVHAGLFDRAITVLGSPRAALPDLRQKAIALGLTVVDYTTIPQRARTYAEMSERLAATNADDLEYLGIAIFGDGRAVKRLTGSLPLLR
jgi:hypothetical protein